MQHFYPMEFHYISPFVKLNPTLSVLSLSVVSGQAMQEKVSLSAEYGAGSEVYKGYLRLWIVKAGK